VRWSVDPLPRAEPFALAGLQFPLCVRGRRPGDRIRLPYGSKKLKKLLGEARIPLSERDRLPVLSEAGGRVLWLPGLARAAGTEGGTDEAVLHVALREEAPGDALGGGRG
jgi:tRNA(Ile)-lysidine synthetase-like protein